MGGHWKIIERAYNIKLTTKNENEFLNLLYQNPVSKASGEYYLGYKKEKGMLLNI